MPARALTFIDFSKVFSFLKGVALFAGKANHYPGWSFTFYRVTTRLTTLDAVSILTGNCRLPAVAIDKMV
ncbi:MAG: 4a-hydroxytetrahydrobiopterin dehydratase [Bacteroidota bacterium]